MARRWLVATSREALVHGKVRAFLARLPCAPSSDRCEGFDLDTGEITIRRIVSMTNGQRPESMPSPSARRTVKIAQRAVDVLDQRRADAGNLSVDQPVFEKRGGGELDPESLPNTFRRLVAHANASPITIAGLGHTHAALLFRTGVSPLVISKHL